MWSSSVDLRFSRTRNNLATNVSLNARNKDKPNQQGQ